MRLVLWFLPLLLCGCVGVPEGLKVVEGFDSERFLGRWYEIARLNHPFERGLSHVTAEYSRRDDGGIGVRNRGLRADGEWKEITGRAYFVDRPDRGQLKVTFSGLFYVGYNVLALDPNYRQILVAGPDRSTLWILSRSPKPAGPTIKNLVAKAAGMGFDTSQLIYVEQPGRE